MKNRFISLLALFPILFGCQSPLPLPQVEHPNEVGFVSPGAEQRRLAFFGGIFDMKRGDLYAVYPYWHWSVPNVNIGIYVCNAGINRRFYHSQEFWDEGEHVFKKEWINEAGVFIERALLSQGYDIKQTRDSVFMNLMKRPSADLLLSARIIDMKMNLCHIYAPLSAIPLNRAGGNGTVTVQWEIYDGVREEILDSFITQGYAEVNEPLQSGEKALLMNALQNAAENLGHTKWFYRMMTTLNPVDLISDKDYKPLSLTTRVSQYHKPIQNQYSFLRRGVITIRAEKEWLGAGFFINNQGYALTSARIVGDAKIVQIMDSNGTKYQAHVLRKNRRHDVALIKADIKDNASLPISDTAFSTLTETVYTIGTPYSNRYRTTITKGIISANRYNIYNGVKYIQADIHTAPGFSGGPLTDDKGNVIGINTTLESSFNRTESSFSVFIPIHDALKVLNIQINPEVFR